MARDQTLLTEALASLERGDEALALDGMLAVWRITPSTRLAEAIDKLDERLRARRPPIKKSLPLAEREAEWARVAAEGRQEDLGWLVAQPWPGKWDDVTARLRLLVNHKQDPRLARHLARMVDDLPFDTIASLSFYRMACDFIVASRDARALPGLERTARPKRHYLDRDYRQILSGAAEALRASLAELTPRPDDEASLSTLRARLGLDRDDAPKTSADASELLDAIAAAPDDDGPRQIYADLLLEAGEPRGEFIALQLARARGKRPGAAAARREKELFAEHGATWVGPLRDVVEDEGVLFARGFVDTVVLGANKSFWRSWHRVSLTGLLEDPVWRTVRRLELVALHDDARAALLDALSPRAFPSLRELIGLSTEDLGRLVALPALPPLTCIGAALPAQRLDGIARFEQLRRLEVSGSLPEWVTTSALWARLEELQLFLRYGTIGADWVHVTSHPTSALGLLRWTDVGSRERHVHYLFERDDEGRFTKLTVGKSENRRTRPYGHGIAPQLESLPPDALTSFTIVDGAIDCWPADQEAIDAVLARFTRLTDLHLPWR